jgi:hypothetical protein
MRYFLAWIRTYGPDLVGARRHKVIQGVGRFSTRGRNRRDPPFAFRPLPYLTKTHARHGRFEHPTAAILKVPSLSGA